MLANKAKISPQIFVTVFPYLKKVVLMPPEKWQLARLWRERSNAAVLPAISRSRQRRPPGGSVYPPQEDLGGKTVTKMPCVYLQYSDTTKKFYTGSSRDDEPSARLKRHNSRQVRSTKAGAPWRIVHVEKFPDYTSARKRELFLKSGAGRQWIRQNFTVV
jgi:putative endonuclease